MKRDKALNLFLFFVLTSVLFVTFFPIYFSFGDVHFRVVTLSERLFSLVFVSLWLMLSVYCAWKKKLYLVLGGAAYAIMAYIPGLILPGISSGVAGDSDPSLLIQSVRFIFEKMYELVNAPMVGVSILFAERQSVSLSRWLLPILVVSYVLTEVFRHYRNAYLAEQLHLEDTAYYPNPDLAREIASVPGTERIPVFSTKEQARASQTQIPDAEEGSPVNPEKPEPARAAKGDLPAAPEVFDSSRDPAFIAAENRDVIPLGAPVPPSPSDSDIAIPLGPPENRSGSDGSAAPKGSVCDGFDIKIPEDSDNIEKTRRFSPPGN